MSIKISTFISDHLTLRYGFYSKKNLEKYEHYYFLLPGRNEFIEKYELILGKIELPENSALILLDHRGQGASEGCPSHVDTYDDYCKDLQVLIKKFCPKEKTYSFITSSMGGLIALYGSLKNYFKPEKIFLCCPLLGLPKSPLWITTALFTSSLLRLLGFGKKRWKNYELDENFEKNVLTGNKKHFEWLKKNPYPPKEGSFSWIRATLHALFYVQKISNVNKLCNEITICVAKNELVVSNEAIYCYIKKIQKEKDAVTLDLYSFDTKHELFFDEESETNRFYEVLNKWMKKSNA